MGQQPISPRALAVRLLVYFAALVLGIFALVRLFPDSVEMLPIGGLDLDLPGSSADFVDALTGAPTPRQAVETLRLDAALTLVASLTGTLLLMLPITWVYMATKRAEGYRRSFIGALLVLPICATSIVLLIQNSLPLAFGLTALVAAVRFRVTLDDALDGIYIFASICVGLASGIGYLGAGAVMTFVFCFVSLFVWSTDYGTNPVDEARQARRLAKLERDDNA